MRYLQDEDSILKLLSSLPASREGGIALLAIGLYSHNEDVQRLATEILRRIEKTTIGKYALGKLNYFLMLKYHSNLQHREVIKPQIDSANY